MPRIRSIKPEFWGDEKMAGLDPMTRLVFLALISLADDAGRLVDNVKTIDGFVFPETEDTSRGSLDILANMCRILRYRSESGQKLIQVAHWSKHQKVDHPNKYVLPPPPDQPQEQQQVASHNPDPREKVSTASRKPRDTISDQRPTTNDQRSASESARARFARIRLSLAEDQADALQGLIRASRNPDAMLAEVEAIASGMRNIQPAPSWPQVGQALLDLSLNGERPTALLLRTYVGRVVRETGPPSNGKHQKQAEDIDGYERAARHFEQQEREASHGH